MTMAQQPLDNSIIHLLHRANQSVSDIFSDQMRGETLTPRQFAVLTAISNNEGLNQTSLVKETGIDRSTLADIIQRMLKKDLISRKRTERDGRAYSVFLTPLGQQLLYESAPNVKNADERILSAVPEENRQEFLDSLHKIISTAQNIKSSEPQSSGNA